MMAAVGTKRGVDYESLIQPDRVSGSLYTDAAIFADELERIWYTSWVFVGHVSEVPNAGDYIARNFGLQPVLMVRDRAGAVNVFSNRCAHRGVKLCNMASGHARAFVCPYHGWAYDLAGRLIDTPHGEEYSAEFLADKGLSVLPRVAEYGGFVFASMAQDGPSLEEHLGDSKQLIDRLLGLSPVGEIELSAGWVRHKFEANWKMLYENDTDGYHPEFTHASFMRATSTHVSDYVVEYGSRGEGTDPVLRDWGGGHAELDWGPGFRHTDAPFVWFGNANPEKFPNYMKSMEATYGAQDAHRKLVDGPPHACIFPNLFLAELSVVMFEPVAVDRTVQWHCPVFFKGASEVNSRIIRQAEAALGPSGFLVADDQVVAELNQQGLTAKNPEWVNISRGMDKEGHDADQPGMSYGSMFSELTNRGFWDHYKAVMA